MNITVKAYAKLNLFLDILGKRPDGYHEIVTAMQLISLADDVTVKIGDGHGVHITCSDPKIPLNNKNTAYKAAQIFFSETGLKKRVDINIIKKIPVMAGLGGSSADAAAVLRALNALCGNPFSLDELLRIGAETGSDVPFCIHGGFALCKGTGTEIAETLPSLNCAFVIIKPEFSCSSKEAYALYSENPLSKKEKTEYFYNAFEMLYNNPEIEKIKRKLMGSGASGACLTGSGSAVFGVFDNMKKAEEAFEKLNYKEKFMAFPLQRLEN
ncbi:MAG: 4-(cytidine 5'-diphospho)-2-C-methyl-D-erythritol kinase [Oscillospiraceae bacterium]|nr:4-(cytidine 5'-diphospho)-2-C-methyl-D-erythritol kinase [Oscillospiraceae bacterium]